MAFSLFTYKIAARKKGRSNKRPSLITPSNENSKRKLCKQIKEFIIPGVLFTGDIIVAHILG
jgi:hypothetical protein